MRIRFLVAGLGLCLVAAAAAADVRAPAAVQVQFVGAEHYTDAGERGYGADRPTLRALERHFTTLGARCLQPGETLALTIHDVDLAGRNEWWHRGAYDLRVMRDITWPRIELDYVWRDAEGRVLGEARERVADMSYLWRSAYVRNDPDPLPYEKAMLRDWFERRFCRVRG